MERAAMDAKERRTRRRAACVEATPRRRHKFSCTCVQVWRPLQTLQADLHPTFVRESTTMLIEPSPFNECSWTLAHGMAVDDTDGSSPEAQTCFLAT